MTAVTIDQSDTKIRELLLMGNSVDVLAEQGVKRGWTRADILRVASANGWELDPSGRIPRGQRTPTLAPTAPPPAPPAVAPAAPADVPPLWRAVAVGRAHPVPAIRKRADRLHQQLQDLAETIEGAEEERKAREKVAELERKLAEAKAALRGQSATTPASPKGQPAVVRAWAKAQGITVPTYGRVPTAVVEQWRNATGSKP